MHVVGHDLHPQHYPVPYQARLPQHLHQPFVHLAKEDLSAVLGGEYQMVVQVVMAVTCGALFRRL